MRDCFAGSIDTDWSNIGSPAWNRMYLYLLKSATGELLYVGITWNIKSRWQQHRLKKEWWPEVASAEVHEHTGTDGITAVLDIRKAERHLIGTMNPTRNIHRPRRARNE